MNKPEYIGKIPNILLDDKYGVVVDELNYELVTLKTKTITENNIKSIQSQYPDSPYGIGDTVNEWVSCNKYGSTLPNILNTYIEIERRQLIMLNKLQPLEDIISVEKELRERIKLALAPIITDEASKSFNSLKSVTKQADETYQELLQLLDRAKVKSGRKKE